MSQARDAFEKMVTTELAPLLRECGFSGNFREFRLRDGDQDGVACFVGSRHNRGVDYKFTVELMIRDRSTGYTRSDHRLGHLTPALTDTWWTVMPGEPTLPLAHELAHDMCNFGAVALRMDMAYPDRDNRVPERRSPSEKLQLHQSRMAAMAAMQKKPSRAQLIDFMESPDAHWRELALWRFGLAFREDTELRPILLRSMSDAVRRPTAVALLRVFDPVDDEIIDALRLALRDERLVVRWEARYALTLHDRHDVVEEEAHHAHWPSM